jgi:periplasmic divalent cation tolerance protein
MIQTILRRGSNGESAFEEVGIMESNEKGILVFTTVPSVECAGDISAALISRKLAACVSTLSEVHSTYRWKDHVEESSEILLMIKTFDRFFHEIADVIKDIHPYDVPEIIATPVTRIHESYAQWMNEVIKPDANRDY